MPLVVKKNLARTLTEREKNDIINKGHTVILNLGDQVLKKVLKENTIAAILAKLENL